MLGSLLTDRKFRVARNWSNSEIERFAPLFSGRVVNVSAWKDEDKQGRRYREYFNAADSYHLTNFRADARGVQGLEGEVFLDLSAPLPDEFEQSFDCVFNHTTLEHIYEVHTAFSNLCRMSRDAVMVVVPFLQEMHAGYGDFWRFTPTCLQRMFQQNGYQPIYTSYNNHFMASVYIFMIAVRNPEDWRNRIASNNGADGIVPYSAEPAINDPFDHFVGCNAVPSVIPGLAARLRSLLRRGPPATG